MPPWRTAPPWRAGTSWSSVLGARAASTCAGRALLHLRLVATHTRSDDRSKRKAPAHSLGKPLGDIEDGLLFECTVAGEARRRKMGKQCRVTRLELPGAEEAEDTRFGPKLDRDVVVSGVQEAGGETGERARGLPRPAGTDEEHAAGFFADRRSMQKQGAAVGKPPVEDLAKRRRRLPERQFIRVTGPEPRSRRRPVVGAELAERGTRREVPAVVSCVDRRPARAAGSERRQRRRRGSRVLGVPHVDRQLWCVPLSSDQVVEGAAQLIGQGDLLRSEAVPALRRSGSSAPRGRRPAQPARSFS